MPVPDRPPDLPRDRARAIEWDCAQLLVGFFNAFDAWRYQDMVASFAPDGVWHRQGKALRGADDILAVLNARSRTQVVRHVVTNVHLTVIDDSHCDSRLYVTAYVSDTGSKTAEPPKIAAPSLLLDVPGKLLRTDEGWHIASLTMTRVFVFG